MKHALFVSNYNTVGFINPMATIDAIERETMLYGASFNFAREHGSVLTQIILDRLEDKIKPNIHYVIDTKSVMLMPEIYPAIPGWHCDGVIRQTSVAQPDLEKMDPNIKHWVVLVSSHCDGVSLTEFLNEPLTIPYEEGMVWGSIDRHLNSMSLQTSEIQDGQIVEFTQPTLHRAMPAFNKGWRYFFRMSESNIPPVNKIRHQVQVYAKPEQGW